MNLKLIFDKIAGFLMDLIRAYILFKLIVNQLYRQTKLELPKNCNVVFCNKSISWSGKVFKRWFIRPVVKNVFSHRFQKNAGATGFYNFFGQEGGHFFQKDSQKMGCLPVDHPLSLFHGPITNFGQVQKWQQSREWQVTVSKLKRVKTRTTLKNKVDDLI